MAKTNENGEQVNETLATDTLANLFAEMNGSVIIHVGPNNTKETDGFTVPMLIPREYGQYADKIAISVSTNWNKKELDGKSVADRVAYFEQHVATQWEPSEPSLRSPIEQAAFDRLLVLNLEAGKIKSTAPEKEKDRVLNPTIAALLNNPAQTERGRPIIEAYLAKFRDYDTNAIKRGRKGAEPAANEPGDLVVGF